MMIVRHSKALILRAFFLCIFFSLSIGAQVPNKRMLDDPLQFTGPESMHADIDHLEQIRIGFFAPNIEHSVGESLWKGAKLAIEEANQGGGCHGKPFRLIHAWADDPWGAGSKEMIRLVYEERVWAVIGSIDGNSTHVAEQIVTKARVPLISPISSDSTLTHIRIPWIFRLPPSEEIQCSLLFDDLNPGKMGLITSTRHDGRIVKDEILKSAARKNLSFSFHYQMSKKEELTIVLEKMREYEIDSLVLHIPPEWMYSLFLQWHEPPPMNLVFTWLPGLDWEKLDSLYDGQIITITPFDHANTDYKQFQKSYHKHYDEKADSCAAYGYDATQLIIQGLKKSGLSRNGLRDALAKMSMNGTTGKIEWDNGGGNRGTPIQVIRDLR